MAIKGVDFDLGNGAIISPGEGWNFQYWFRLPGTTGFDLSDGLGVTFIP